LYKLTFWLVSHLAQDSSLLDQIREEVLPAVQGEHVEEMYLLEKCPKLSSVVSETLRLTVTSSLARVILEPTAVGGKLLRPGNKIMVRRSVFLRSSDRMLTPLQLPIRELHYDTNVWGPTPEKLNPNRFVENPKLSQSLSYRPWGGGHTLCPGRLFARRSVNAFVAILLTKYDVAIASNGFPKADGARPSPGVVTLGQGEDLKLRLTPQNCD
jgi:cytochrome P450